MQRHFDFLVLGAGTARVSAVETLRNVPSERSIALVSVEDRLPYLAEVLMRRDEIVFAQHTRNDVLPKEKIGDFRPLVQEIMDSVEPEARERLRQNPRFIQLMAEAGPTSIARIVNEVRRDELSFLDNDFSVTMTKEKGYQSQLL